MYMHAPCSFDSANVPLLGIEVGWMVVPPKQKTKDKHNHTYIVIYTSVECAPPKGL